MKNILVTGGNGFIGSHLVEKLIERGEFVTVFDISDIGPNLSFLEGNKHFKYIKGDITDIEILKDVIEPELDLIYHLSSVVGVNRYISNPLNVIDVNIIGTRNIFDLASKNKIKVLFTSTSEIYGNNPQVPWPEDSERLLGPTTVDRWTYSTSKALCEHMGLGMHKAGKLNISIVRYFNVYGPRQTPILVVSQNIHKILNGKKPLIYDGGLQSRCFTYVEDAIDATIKVANSQLTNGEIFNIGSSTETSIISLLEMICEVCNVSPNFEKLDTSKHYGTSYQDILRRVPDVRKIYDFIGWEMQTSLLDGLKYTVAWAKNNKEWLSLSNE